MPQNSSLRLAVLVSGGVDSSVALRLLHAAGHSYTAFYLKIWFQQQISSFSCFILRWSCTISQNEMQSKQKDLELEANALIFVGGKVSVDILPLMKLLSFAMGVLPDHVPKHLNGEVAQFLMLVSGDSTTRIWKIADGACDSSVQNEPVNVVVLQHFKESTNEKSKEPTY
ncbi:hypothetical protein JHK85_001676 [Glycine max]|nr:hypothetical protein JHK85_001676 [Glycine max]